MVLNSYVCHSVMISFQRRNKTDVFEFICMTFCNDKFSKKGQNHFNVYVYDRFLLSVAPFVLMIPTGILATRSTTDRQRVKPSVYAASGSVEYQRLHVCTRGLHVGVVWLWCLML